MCLFQHRLASPPPGPPLSTAAPTTASICPQCVHYASPLHTLLPCSFFAKLASHAPPPPPFAPSCTAADLATIIALEEKQEEKQEEMAMGVIAAESIDESSKAALVSSESKADAAASASAETVCHDSEVSTLQRARPPTLPNELPGNARQYTYFTDANRVLQYFRTLLVISLTTHPPPTPRPRPPSPSLSFLLPLSRISLSLLSRTSSKPTPPHLRAPRPPQRKPSVKPTSMPASKSAASSIRNQQRRAIVVVTTRWMLVLASTRSVPA